MIVIERANDNERRAYQRAAPFPTGEEGTLTRMQSPLMLGQKVCVISGPLEGKKGVIAAIQDVSAQSKVYSLDNDDIPTGGELWGPFYADQLKRI